MTELIIDSFAGGGGASLGIERAMGRPVDIAINHDPEAVAMHRANHTGTEHFCQNVWQVDPDDIARRGPIGLAWFSPDCTHHSKAKGGRPIRTGAQRARRDLAWVVVHWAQRAKPRVIMLENVEEFQDWGPLLESGKPCPVQKGLTFKRWVKALKAAGYKVKWWELRACDFGAPTIRKRLFVTARRDGKPIVRPEPTHGPGLLPYRTAADCIDWSIPVHSIFMTPEEAKVVGVRRPLAEATMRRIARGVFRYVIDAADPFFVTYAQHGGGVRSGSQPLHTVTASTKDQNCIVTPTLIQTGYGERPGQAPRVPGLEKPLGTVVAGGSKHALVAAFLAQHNTGVVGHDMRKPISTIVGKGCTQAVCAAHLMSLKGSDRRDRPVTEPAPTQTAGGWHIAEVRAFLVKYYGTGGQWQDCRAPMHTLSTKARMGLVTVHGVDYQIADIGMRMLTPRELFRAQGFPASYIIDPEVNGKPLTKTAQIRMCGNSVCPDVAAAVVRANMAVAAAGLVAAG